MYDIEPLTNETNKLLCQQVRNGGKEALDRMVLGNLRLVHRKVRSFLRQNPQYNYLSDDLTSEGCLGLAQAVTALANSKRVVANPVGYLCRAITNAISAAAQVEGTNMSPQARQYAKSKDEEILPLKRVPFTSLYKMKVEPHAMVDARHTIFSCAETPEDRTLLTMREVKYTFSEIADALGCSKSWVHRRVNMLGDLAEAKIRRETFKE